MWQCHTYSLPDNPRLGLKLFDPILAETFVCEDWAYRLTEPFHARGYVATQRNTVARGDEWLASTTMQKQLAKGSA